MKSKISLRIDNKLLEAAKAIAASQHISLSELFGNYLIDVATDLKDKYYMDRANKYGF